MLNRLKEKNSFALKSPLNKEEVESSESSNPELIKNSSDTQNAFEFGDEFVLTVPLYLQSKYIIKQERSFKGPSTKGKPNVWVAQAFANKLNNNLNSVCSEIAQNYYRDFCKSKSKRCVFTAIIPKSNYNYKQVFATGAGNAYYFEYAFHCNRYLFILKSTQ